MTDLGEGDEEELLVGEVDGWQGRLTADVFRRPVLVGVVGRLQSATVRDVLTERLTPAQLYTVQVVMFT